MPVNVIIIIIIITDDDDDGVYMGGFCFLLFGYDWL